MIHHLGTVNAQNVIQNLGFGQGWSTDACSHNHATSRDEILNEVHKTQAHTFSFKNTLIIKQTDKTDTPNQTSFFTVLTAWICRHTNHLKTWERNSSWLWRTRKASRASTKTSHFRILPTNEEKKRKQNATQRCQTSCCSSSVQACCTVMPDCEPTAWWFEAIQLVIEPTYLQLCIFSVRG